ncbi:MAG: amino acid/amide transporter substrate-binding protein family [Firmicutes bacterium]|nr:amino acid/amide transporter substrate-binding protein family [Bacillota bacterium]
MSMKRIGALVLSIALLGIAGCGGAASKSGDKVAQRPDQTPGATGTKEPITIAAVVSLTGAVADLGRQDQVAVQVVADQINAAGGIMGRPLKVVFYDEAAEPAEILDKATKDGVVAFAGWDNSATALKIYPEIMKQKKVMMISGAGSPALTDAVAKDPTANKYLFRNGNHARDWARSASLYMRDIQKAKTYVYVAQDNPFGKSLEGVIAELAKTDGITPVGSLYFERGSSNFDAVLKLINEKKPDVIIGYMGPSGLAFAKTYTDQKIAVPMLDIAASGLELEDKVKAEVGNKADFIAVTLFADNVPITSKTKPFYTAYQAKAGSKPGGLFDVRAGDAISILAEAITQAGSVDADKVVPVLERKTFTGAAGIYEFDSSHQAKWGPSRLSGLLAQWQDGQLKVIWPAETKSADYKPAPWWKK